MVRRRLSAGGSAFGLAAAMLILTAACGLDREMANRTEMPDTMEVKRALESPRARDSMLDTLPGGEMVRGDTAASTRLLRDKMRDRDAGTP